MIELWTPAIPEDEPIAKCSSLLAEDLIPPADWISTSKLKLGFFSDERATAVDLISELEKLVTEVCALEIKETLEKAEPESVEMEYTLPQTVV